VHDEVAGAGLLERTFYADAGLSPDRLEAIPSVPLAPGRHDVLHAHFGPDARRFLFARAQANAPFVVTFHGYDFSAWPREHGTAQYDLLFDVADLVTYNCEHARAALESLGCPSHKLTRLRMPIVVDDFPFRTRRLRPGQALRVLTVGRLVEKKGHSVALEAIAELTHEIPVRYDIVGGGPLADALAARVAELGLDDVVHMHDSCDSAFVRRQLAQADLFLLASMEAADGDQEGTPVALMEAQACGLPVVSTLHAGIPEVVLDGRTGLLVPEREPAELAAAIRQLVRDHASWPALGAAGRTHVEETFDVAHCTEELLGVYARSSLVCSGLVQAGTSST
jgi:colanic acid/amylovoran biosynthesis glycosyltransferase